VSAPCVGLFVDSFTPITDGVTLTVRNYAHWLSRTLGPTCVVTPAVPGHRDSEAFPVVRFFSLPTVVRPPYRLGLAGLHPGLREDLKSREFAIVHAHSPFSAGRLALRVARERGVPIVATFHSKFRDDLCRAIRIRCLVRDEVRRIVDFLCGVDQVWIPQASMVGTLREYGYHGPCHVVENGIDFTPPGDITPWRARGGRHLELPDHARVGLFVGQLILEKNLELLLASVREVRARIPGFRLVLVGEGYARRRLQKQVRELGLQASVLFHDAVCDRRLLQAIYARADVFLLPSLYDNAPLVVREAAALGVPSVLLRGSTAAEVIDDGENGFLSDNHVQSFAARVVDVLQDEEARARAGSGARRTLCRTWESVAREIRSRYLAILAETA
jgi:glycosyltransferase involved in cell wall biosynthesis